MTQKRSAIVVMALVAAVLAISTSALLIRGAQSAVVGAGLSFSLFIAAARMLTASAILSVPVWRQRERRTPEGVKFALLAGLGLGLHFGFWISSLAFTSVASSVTLVTTNPLWVALFGTLFFQERVSRRGWLGVTVAVTGSVVIGLSDAGAGGSMPLLGDGLALLGAVAMSMTLLLGKRAQERGVSTLVYIGISNLVAAIVLVPVALLSGANPFEMPSAVYGFVLLMALVPQLIGHGAMAWSLKHVSATTIALVVLFEPIVASGLAWALFGEMPSLAMAIGAMVVLLGVGLLVSERRQDS